MIPIRQYVCKMYISRDFNYVGKSVRNEQNIYIFISAVQLETKSVSFRQNSDSRNMILGGLIYLMRNIFAKLFCYFSERNLINRLGVTFQGVVIVMF